MRPSYFLLFIISIFSLPLQAQNFWTMSTQETSILSAKSATTLKQTFSANSQQEVDVDFDGISQALLNIDESLGYIDLQIPLPNGEFSTYRFTESSIMQSGIAANYPEIKTFKGVDTSDVNNNGRFDVNELGFHGMFRHKGELIYIDPEYIGNTSDYASYYAKDATPLNKNNADTLLETINNNTEGASSITPSAKASSSGNEVTFELLISASGLYTEYFGSKTAALAAIVTMVNRVNEVYQSDLGITLELIDETEDYIFTDSDTDPYPDDGWLQDLQANADTTAGDSSKFDIGHLVTTTSGGVAYAGVCNSTYKAQGLTGSSSPTGDSFYIDYVAHEIGHQFNANHTFNGTTSSCGGGNRSSTTAYEPGSGSSIMAYAGICGDESLQDNSDAYFHAASIDEITTYITTGYGATCSSSTTSSNTPPTADAGSDFTIPSRVPFILQGSASDDDGDSILYTWEQMDLGDSSSSQATMEDDGSRPIFRTWEGTTSSIRYLPRLEDVIENTTSIGEAYPASDRDLNFRLTVRDQNNGTAYDDLVITVVTTDNIFEFTSPSSLSSWSIGESQSISWEVANTDISPISCSSVDILLSPSNDGDFSVVLADSIVNDGSATVIVPSSFTSDSNLMLRCDDLRFFNVLNNKVSISNISASSSSSDGSGSFGWWIIMVFSSLCALRYVERSRYL